MRTKHKLAVIPLSLPLYPHCPTPTPPHPTAWGPVAARHISERPDGAGRRPVDREGARGPVHFERVHL